MHTDSRAREHVLYALGEFAADYDTDAILSDLYDVADSWDVLTIDPDTFWTIVRNHDHPFG